jgi:hypothetical protein
MHIFWYKNVPPLEQEEEKLKLAYQEYKRKVKDFEVIKKEC